MARPEPKLHFNTDFQPQTGQAVEEAPAVVRVTAPNASAFTFTGTNTYLLGKDRVALVDPGPEDNAHKTALRAAIAGREVTAILLTHTHRDHSASAKAWAEELSAPLWFGGAHRLSRPLRRFEVDPLRGSSTQDLVPDLMLVDGETITAGDIAVTVHATPGHCANHLAFGIAGTDVLLSGDHVMGWNSTLVAVPDGSMSDYLTSLDRLIALPYKRYLPGHGGPIADGPVYASALRAHRQLRSLQVASAVKGGARSINAVLDRIYPKQSPRVRFAARMTINAHVEYLEERGEVVVRRGLFGARLYPAA